MRVAETITTHDRLPCIAGPRSQVVRACGTIHRQDLVITPRARGTIHRQDLVITPKARGTIHRRHPGITPRACMAIHRQNRVIRAYRAAPPQARPIRTGEVTPARRHRSLLQGLRRTLRPHLLQPRPHPRRLVCFTRTGRPRPRLLPPATCTPHPPLAASRPARGLRPRRLVEATTRRSSAATTRTVTDPHP